jgi:hypothetical protein
VLYSVDANARHGYPRSNDDKRQAVMTLLRDEEWSQWSDSEIARRCAVTHPFVGKLRASLVTVSSDPPAVRTYTTKHDTQATMNTAGIGRRANAPAPFEPSWRQTNIEAFVPRYPPEHTAPAGRIRWLVEELHKDLIPAQAASVLFLNYF